ncbi:putative DGQHR domain protein [Aliivibrio fischeri MJ11]|uniref:DGQHR domain protein n=2 Tax=Aliivibrio fischeri TaxID=668 RepID=B5ESQ6_ALIFM|nr:putative DGQHR domain protein [Aliivibrio fischeri MJ11]
MEPFYSTGVIEVSQPMGDFYVFKISAKKLVSITFSMAAYNQNGKLSGVQRKLRLDRIKQIALYSNSYNATFPNSIILSANFDVDGSLIVDDKLRWDVKNGELTIPTDKKIASIIDGQHRLEGIREAIKNPDFQDFDILCSVYIDMPFSEQAEVFTSINFNQKKVDKSIAYELFGYDLDETDKAYWSPDTLAIYLTRIFNNDPNSPIKGKVFTSFVGEVKNEDWYISTACLVESISLLMTTDATKDRYYLHQSAFFNKGRVKLKDLKVKAPLRNMYIKGNDKDIFVVINNYLSKLQSLGWFSSSDLVTTKTIGFLAMFEVLRDILNSHEESEFLDIDFEFMRKVRIELLHKSEFNFSGIGKSQIKNLILDAIK